MLAFAFGCTVVAIRAISVLNATPGSCTDCVVDDPGCLVSADVLRARAAVTSAEYRAVGGMREWTSLFLYGWARAGVLCLDL